MKGNRMTTSQLCSILGWVSVFGMGWMFVLRLIPQDALSWGFFVFFFLVAIFASVSAMEKKGVR